ncbi:MAG: helix-turn-helix transcriptional regulator [Lachnospiraceae bacterium]|nr:helix-turn-helix transcriptional regulator [Lachnospiraceae bacterium]MCD8010787.1 helix-turn-helix transcriptional regulator [Lachnospiraceae bacterium]
MQSLQQLQENTDAVFQLTADNINIGVWKREILSLLVNPDVADAERVSDVLQELENLADGNYLIRQIWLYCTYSDWVYSSTGTSITLDYFANREVIEDYMEQYEAFDSGQEETGWCVTYSQGKIILALNIRLPRLVGVVLAEINASVLWQYIEGQLENQPAETAILSEKGVLLDSLWDMGLDLASDDLIDTENLTGDYYVVQSSHSGWIFLMNQSDPSLTLSLPEIGRMLAPLLLIYLCVSLFLAWFVTKEIYRPIRYLLKIASGRPLHNSETIKGLDEERHEKKNELTWLGDIYSDTVDQNQRYSDLITLVYHEVVESMMRRIVQQREYTEESLRETLDGFGRGELWEGDFAVQLYEIRKKGQRNPTEIEINLYQKSLLDLLAQKNTKNIEIFAFFTRTNRCCAVIWFVQRESSAQRKQVLKEIRSSMEAETEKLPYTVNIFQSQICHPMQNLSYAYQETVRLCQSQQTEEPSAELTKKNELRDMYVKQIDYITETAKSGNEIAAIREYQRFLSGVVKESGDIEETRKHIQWIVDELVLQMLALRPSDAESMDSVCLEAYETTEEITEYVLAYGEKCLRQICLDWKKKSRWYVEEAKTYMRTHFAEGDLSLDEISRSVGISSQYLSSLFTELTGNSVIYYLNTCRINQSQKLLEATDLSVQEVGLRCGFNSMQSYCRVYKKHTGGTPGKYRAEKKKERSGG